MSKKKQIKRTRSIRARFTDDSGVVISMRQYAELHGEPHASQRHLADSQQVPNRSPGVFARIGQKGDSRKVECDYCHAIVLLAGIAFHTQSWHQTLELRFRPVKAPYNPNSRTVLQDGNLQRISGKGKVLECEYCHKMKHEDEIGDHTRKKHHTNKLRFKVIAERETSERQQKKDKNPPPGPKNYGCSMDEMEDQTDGMAHFRREGNGQFGSFPMHDDYGDESGS